MLLHSLSFLDLVTLSIIEVSECAGALDYFGWLDSFSPSSCKRERTFDATVEPRLSFVCRPVSANGERQASQHGGADRISFLFSLTSAEMPSSCVSGHQVLAVASPKTRPSHKIPQAQSPLGRSATYRIPVCFTDQHTAHHR